MHRHDDCDDDWWREAAIMLGLTSICLLAVFSPQSQAWHLSYH